MSNDSINSNVHTSIESSSSLWHKTLDLNVPTMSILPTSMKEQWAKPRVWSEQEKQQRLEHLKTHLVEDFTEQMRQNGVIISQLVSQENSKSTLAYNLYRRYLSLDGFLLSVWLGDHQTVNALLKHMGSSLQEHRSADKKNALMIAVSNDDLVMVPLLTPYIDINACDANGASALHYAVMRSCAPMVQLLLECGANINASNNKKVSIWHAALAQNDEQVLEVLSGSAWWKSMNPLLKDEGGVSVWEYALQLLPMKQSVGVFGQPVQSGINLMQKFTEHALVAYSKEQVSEVKKRRAQQRLACPEGVNERKDGRATLGKKLVLWIEQYMEQTDEGWRDAPEKKYLLAQVKSALEQRYLNQVMQQIGEGKKVDPRMIQKGDKIPSSTTKSACDEEKSNRKAQNPEVVNEHIQKSFGFNHSL